MEIHPFVQAHVSLDKAPPIHLISPDVKLSFRTANLIPKEPPMPIPYLPAPDEYLARLGALARELGLGRSSRSTRA